MKAMLISVLDSYQKQAAVDKAVGKISRWNDDWTVPVKKNPERPASESQLRIK